MNSRVSILAFLLMAAFFTACKNNPGSTPEPKPDPGPDPDTTGTKSDTLNPQIKDDYTDMPALAIMTDGKNQPKT